MDIEFIIVNWLLKRLKEENLISETICDDTKKKVLQNLLGSTENFELEDRVA